MDVLSKAHAAHELLVGVVNGRTASEEAIAEASRLINEAFAAHSTLLAQTRADGEKLRSQELLLTRAKVDEQRMQEGLRAMQSDLQQNRSWLTKARTELERERECPESLSGTELGKLLRRCKEHAKNLRDFNSELDEDEAAAEFEALMNWVRRAVAYATGQSKTEMPEHARQEIEHTAQKLYTTLVQQAILVASVRTGAHEG